MSWWSIRTTSVSQQLYSQRRYWVVSSASAVRTNDSCLRIHSLIFIKNTTPPFRSIEWHILLLRILSMLIVGRDCHWPSHQLNCIQWNILLLHHFPPKPDSIVQSPSLDEESPPLGLTDMFCEPCPKLSRHMKWKLYREGGTAHSQPHSFSLLDTFSSSAAALPPSTSPTSPSGSQFLLAQELVKRGSWQRTSYPRSWSKTQYLNLFVCTVWGFALSQTLTLVD